MVAGEIFGISLNSWRFVYWQKEGSIFMVDKHLQAAVAALQKRLAREGFAAILTCEL